MNESQDEKTIIAGPGDEADGTGGAGDYRSRAPKARLICIDTSQVDGSPGEIVIHLENNVEKVVGRDAGDCDVCIPTRKLSRKHVRIIPGTGVWGVEDLKSTNGVKVNGSKVASAWLHHGDEVRFGPVVFRYELDRPEPEARVPSGISEAKVVPVADEGEDERTMLVGSREASDAVLKAQKIAEKEAAVAFVQPIVSAKASVAPRKMGRKSMALGMLALLLVGLVVAGAFHWPGYNQRKMIDKAVRETDRLATRVATERRDPLVQPSAATEESLKELEGRLRMLLADAPGNVDLSNALASVVFLSYEAEIKKLLDDKDVAGARRLAVFTAHRLSDLMAPLKGVSEMRMEPLRTAWKLALFGDTIIEFLVFRLTYGVPSRSAATMPRVAELDRLEALKADFGQHRRTYNRAMSVEYLIYRELVSEVDLGCIPLVEEWRNFIAQDR